MAHRSKLAIVAVAAAILATIGATSVAAAPDTAPKQGRHFSDGSYCC
jgi:hypothetical protein